MSTRELFTYLIIGIVFILFFSRGFASMLQVLIEWLMGPKKHKNQSLDGLIEREKYKINSHLNKSPHDPASSPTKKKQIGPPLSRSETAYLEQLKKYPQNSLQYKEAKFFTSLLEQGVKGQGDAFKELQLILKNQLKIPINDFDLLPLLTQFYAKDYFILQQRAIDKNTFLNLIKVFYYFKTLVKEIEDGKGQFIEELLSNSQSSASLIEKTVVFVLLSANSKSSDALLSQINKRENAIHLLDQFETEDFLNSTIDLTVNKKTLTILTQKEITSMFITQAQLFDLISPLPQKPKQSAAQLTWARKIFAMTGDENKKDIQKKYKSLAKSNHPDRLAGKNIPEKFVKTAHENFNLLQEAYQILLDTCQSA